MVRAVCCCGAAGNERQFSHGERFALEELGDFHLPAAGEGISDDVWRDALDRTALQHAEDATAATETHVPDEVAALLTARDDARAQHDWTTADTLRAQIEASGWRVVDTPEGSRVEVGDGQMTTHN